MGWALFRTGFFALSQYFRQLPKGQAFAVLGNYDADLVSALAPVVKPAESNAIRVFLTDIIFYLF
ncbi:hypothetical protein HFN63_32655 [Rhizobium leguminosarum]|uniref:hypothetical protein n=1 Tax=Rhizobium leguminosarum TaxID=384 RepID=UPI001C96D223|nr:hypothetical protein [Rhizobium leguminosarum]MBY5774788.1 hypothetical protein [Rhizobium leguminosarum]